MTCDRRSFRVVAYRPDNGHCWPTRSTGDDSTGHDLLFLGGRAPPPHALLPRADNNEGVLLFSRAGLSRCQNRAIIVALFPGNENFHRVNDCCEGCCEGRCFLATLWFTWCSEGQLNVSSWPTRVEFCSKCVSWRYYFTRLSFVWSFRNFPIVI